MSRYSIAGYLIALRNRSTHTICTEGKDDRLAVKHCLYKLVGDNEKLNSKYVVDTMDIIESGSAKLGNAEKLKKICTVLTGTSICDKVTALVDREYDLFDINSDNIDLCPSHQKKDQYLYYTRGHSLENYFFEPEYFIQYIEFNHPASLTANHRQIIILNWELILHLAASLTFSIHEHSCCSKSMGLFNMNNWCVNNAGNIQLLYNTVESSLISRGIPSNQAAIIVNRATVLKQLFSDKSIVSRWITHGHVGLDLICGAVGAILANCGVDKPTCQSIHGFSEIKIKHFISQWVDRSKTIEALFPALFFNRILEQIKKIV